MRKPYHDGQQGRRVNQFVDKFPATPAISARFMVE